MGGSQGSGTGFGVERGLALKGQHRDPGGDGSALCQGGVDVSTLAEVPCSTATIWEPGQEHVGSVCQFSNCM